MDFEKYTERSRGFVQSAQMLAQRSGHQQLTPEHLLNILIEDSEGLAAGLIRAAGGDVKKVTADVEAALKKLPKVEGAGAGQVYLSGDTAKVFDQAEQAAKKAGDGYVTAERLLLALALVPGTAAHAALAAGGVTPQGLNRAIEEIRKGRTAQSPTAVIGDGY